MSYLVFARKWRPKNFEEVLGQEHVTTTLKNAISLNRIAHAYLFAGPRGVGKTTVARILAKALNCEKGPTEVPCNRCVFCQEIGQGTNIDVLEIDGASNRGIDEIRTLRENIKFAPISGRYKIYIIDEVHQITQDAFNALLKTLEEPPLHVVFIFATTQPNRVPSTILSRCQRFDFRRIPASLIARKLKEIAQEENISAEEKVIFTIARSAEGSLRDAEVLLDQLSCATEGKISMEDVVNLLGVLEEDILFEVVEKIKNKDTPSLLTILDKIIAEGKDPYTFLNSLIEYFRSLLLCKVVKKEVESILDLSEEELKRVSQLAEGFSREELFYILQVLIHTQEVAKRAISVRLSIEMALIKISEREELSSLEELMRRIEELKRNIKEGEKEKKASSIETKSVVSDKPPLKKIFPEKKENLDKVVENKAVVMKSDTGKNLAGKKITLEEVQTIWGRFVEEIKQLKMHLGIYLSEAILLSLEENILTLGFPRDKNLHKETLEKITTRQLIEKELQKMTGSYIKLNFTTIKEDNSDSTAVENNAEHNMKNNSSFEQKALNDPLIEKVMRTFGGTLIKGEKFDLS
ncbi:MAG: DNA polymerase III subunit gamma/tau [Candidatus Omnitrophota bacterium]